MSKLKQTPSQTVGPYFAYGLVPEQYRYDFMSIADHVIADPEVPGERILLSGRVFDGEGNPIPDALVEIWQADASGAYQSASPIGKAFRGFGRAGTGVDPNAKFWFDTIKPGSVEDQAPHLNVIVTMRGLLIHVFTRIYFSDEESTNATDKILNAVPADRRHTLIAQRNDSNGRTEYTFDIYMQGDSETVFFDL